MVTRDEARKMALSLPGAEEIDHHGRRAFRVAGGRIFATIWAEDRLNVMVDEPVVRLAVQRDPHVFEAVPWGSRIAAVAVRLPDVDEGTLRDLLASAHASKSAPARRRS